VGAGFLALYTLDTSATAACGTPSTSMRTTATS
jgi:hypothetical protein